MDSTAGHEGEGGGWGLESLQPGGSGGSPSRPPQPSLKPLTINTDLISPPGVSESRRYVLLIYFSVLCNIVLLLTSVCK